MVHTDMDTIEQVLKTKDFAAVAEDGVWYITGARVAQNLMRISQGMSPRLGMEDAAASWLTYKPAQGLLKQFWSHEHNRFEAADEDEAYALLVHVQKTFSDRTLN